MKSSELKAMPLEELREHLENTIKGLYEARMQATIKELSDTSVLRSRRRDVARLKQVIAEKEKGEQSAK